MRQGWNDVEIVPEDSDPGVLQKFRDGCEMAEELDKHATGHHNLK